MAGHEIMPQMEKGVGESQPQANGTFRVHAEPSRPCLCRTALEANQIGRSLTDKMRYKVKATASNQHLGTPEAAIPAKTQCFARFDCFPR